MTRIDKHGRTVGRRAKWPFEQLAVGEFFFLRGMSRNITGPYMVHWKKMFPDRKWKSKTVEGGVEVWRVK